jgi:sulfur-oxidizing protein SoxZ
MKAHWGGSVSKTPYIAFAYKGAAGDKIKLTWKDTKGGTDTGETVVA